MPTRFTITPPADYDLARDVCSYGYFLLSPNHWEPATRTFTRTLALEGGGAKIDITQPRKRGAPLTLTADRSLSAAERADAKGQISRMLRLDEDAAHVRAFHKLDPRWKRSGRGRLLRSPSFFEDVIKTVTSCNVTWPSTVSMNRRLCEVFGEPSPTG
ncbi:MAG: hypothetical protein ABMA01_22370, partial [Chthoniobacteraceae bacterium]